MPLVLECTPEGIIGCVCEFFTCDEVDDGRFANTGFTKEDDIWSVDIDNVLWKGAQSVLMRTNLRAVQYYLFSLCWSRLGTRRILEPETYGTVLVNT